MRNAIASLALASCVLTACERERDEPPRLTTEVRPAALVDNLYVIDPTPGGGLAPMGGAVGRFFLRDRCLIVDADGVARTPVFRGRVEVGRDGLRIGGRLVPYGSEVGLPMISGPVRLEPGSSGNCPTEGVVIRSRIGKLGSSVRQQTPQRCKKRAPPFPAEPFGLLALS